MSDRLRPRIIVIAAALLAANLGSWVWALVALDGQPILLGTALLAYGLGLRHAVDPDHIAAIDNVTRKLLQLGRRPVTVGFYFALGHSTVVVAASAATAAAASALSGRLDAWRDLGSAVGTAISALFLLMIAIMNLAILRDVWRRFGRVRRGDTEALDTVPAASHGGLLARLFRPLFALMTRSWHMYPLGLLFGLGFDTATEVALLALSAQQAAHGLPAAALLVFPALFTAGMTLVDTADGILMLGAYGWAFVRPIRKLYYNLTITLASALVAVLIGGIEALALIGQQFGLTGGLWTLVAALNDHFGSLGFLIVGLFVATWAAAAMLYRIRGYDALEAGG